GRRAGARAGPAAAGAAADEAALAGRGGSIDMEGKDSSGRSGPGPAVVRVGALPAFEIRLAPPDVGPGGAPLPANAEASIVAVSTAPDAVSATERIWSGTPGPGLMRSMGPATGRPAIGRLFAAGRKTRPP